MDSGRQKKWITKDSQGRVKGPFSTRALLERISNGKVSEEDMLSRYPGGDWQPISKNLDFYDRLLETLAKESRPAKNQSAPKTEKTPIDPTMRGRVVPDQGYDQFVMTPPKALPNSDSDSSAEKSQVSKISETEKNDDSVIDLQDKVKLVKTTGLKKLWKPIAAVVLVLICLTLYLLTPSTPKGRIHLRPPLTGGSPMKQVELEKAYVKVRDLFFLDTFEGYWKAQNQLIRLLSSHPKARPLRSLLCLTYRELWPYSYQDREDLEVFSRVVNTTRKMDPNGKDGMLCESSLALAKGQNQKAQNLIETALPLNVREPSFYEMRAFVWGSQRKYSLAIDYLKTIQNLEPEWIKPYRMQGDFYTKINRIPEAIKSFQALLQLNPNHEVGNIELGVLEYRFLNNLDKARQHIVIGLKKGQQLPPLVRVSGLKVLAEIYLKEGSKNKAIDHFKMAYSYNPNDREIQRRLSQLGAKDVLKKQKKKGAELLALAEHYERQGDCFAAQAEYRAVFDANPKNARAAYKAATCLWKLSQAKEAIEWLDKALKSDPKYVEAYVKKSEYYAERFDFRAATRVLRRAMKIAPKNHLVYRGFGRLNFKRNDFASSLSYSEKALSLYQTDVDSMILRVKALLGMKSYSKAYSKSVQLRSFDPANPEVQEVYVRSLAAVQNLDSAMSVTRELIENYPYTLEYRFLYGQLLREDERYDSAESVFRQVLQIDEDYKPAMLELGLSLQAQGKFNEGRDLFLRAAIQDPSDPEALFRLGRLYLVAGNPKAALTQFSRVLNNNSLYPNAHYYAGQAALAVKDFRRALEEGKKEAQMNPHRADPHILMGNVYFFLRDYANCIASYQKAIKLRPPNSNLYVDQARCYRLNGGLHTALQLLRTAELKEPGNPRVWKEMGAVCETKENISCAVEAYRQYLTLAPNAPDRSLIEGRIGKILRR